MKYSESDIKLLAKVVAEGVVSGKRPREIASLMSNLQILPQYIEQLSQYMHQYCLAYFEVYYEFPKQRELFVTMLSEHIKVEMREAKRFSEVITDNAENENKVIDGSIVDIKKEDDNDSKATEGAGVLVTSVENSSIQKSSASSNIQTTVGTTHAMNDEAALNVAFSVIDEHREQTKVQQNIANIMEIYKAPEKFLSNKNKLDGEMKSQVIAFVRDFLLEMTVALPAASKAHDIEISHINQQRVSPSEGVRVGNSYLEMLHQWRLWKCLFGKREVIPQNSNANGNSQSSNTVSSTQQNNVNITSSLWIVSPYLDMISQWWFCQWLFNKREVPPHNNSAPSNSPSNVVIDNSIGVGSDKSTESSKNKRWQCEIL